MGSGVETTQIEIIHEYELSLKKIATQCPPSNVASEILFWKSKVEKWNVRLEWSIFRRYVSFREGKFVGISDWFHPQIGPDIFPLQL